MGSREGWREERRKKKEGEEERSEKEKVKEKQVQNMEDNYKMKMHACHYWKIFKNFSIHKYFIIYLNNLWVRFSQKLPTMYNDCGEDHNRLQMGQHIQNQIFLKFSTATAIHTMCDYIWYIKTRASNSKGP